MEIKKITFNLENFQSFLEDLVEIIDYDHYDRGYYLYRHFQCLDNGIIQYKDENEDGSYEEWKDIDINGEIIE